MDDVPIIVPGIPEGLVGDASELLREAFEQKIAHELRPSSREQALRIICDCIDPSRALVALDDRGVAGLAAVAKAGAPFMTLRFGVLRREFGVPGALWRKAYSLLEALSAPRSATTARLEVLAVRVDARGRGIGGALLDAALRQATEEGMRRLTLEVVDTNGRARDLYERHGFSLVRTLRTGLITGGGGYRAVHFMRRTIP